MSLLKILRNVSPFRGLPVDDKGSASSITTVTGETVQLYYYSGSTLTADAGQAAGTVVVGQLTYNNIKNLVGNLEASKNDTSLSFTSTALTTEVAIPMELFENADESTGVGRAQAITSSLSSGQYVVDYASGTIYGKKASTATTLTSATYKYQANATSSAGGTVTVVGNVASDAVDSGNPVKVGLKVHVTSPTFGDGDRADLQGDINGYLKNREQYVDQFVNNTNAVAHTSPKFYNSSTAKPISTTTLSFTTSTISSSPCVLVGARIVNTTASVRYLFLNNATSIAGAATPTVAPILIPASGAYHLTPEELGKLGEVFSTALTIGNSSTAATFTAGSAGDLLVTLYYVTATS